MKRLLALVAVLIALSGCRNSAPPAQDPFFGRTTVPPPATGTAGTRACDPYYPQQPNAPLQPIPQPQLQPQPGVSPSPLNSPSPGYTPPNGYSYPGKTAGSGVGDTFVATPAPSPAAVIAPDPLGSTPSIIRIPLSEAASSPALVQNSDAATDTFREPVLRTLQPRPREATSQASTVVAREVGSQIPTRAAPADGLTDILDLPATGGTSAASTARSTAELNIER